MGLKTVYRAVRIDGIVHGGGGIKQRHWRRTYKQANKELDELIAAYDDSFGCVEAYQLDEAKAFELLRQPTK